MQTFEQLPSFYKFAKSTIETLEKGVNYAQN